MLVVSCMISKGKGQKKKKLRASLPSPFVFKCKLFLPRCLSLILPFSIHCISKLKRWLLRFCIIKAAFPLSLQNVGLDTMTLQSGRDFNIVDFNKRTSSTIFLESLVIALFVPTRKITNLGFILDDWLDMLTDASDYGPGKMKKPLWYDCSYSAVSGWCHLQPSGLSDNMTSFLGGMTLTLWQHSLCFSSLTVFDLVSSLLCTGVSLEGLDSSI